MLLKLLKCSVLFHRLLNRKGNQSIRRHGLHQWKASHRGSKWGWSARIPDSEAHERVFKRGNWHVQFTCPPTSRQGKSHYTTTKMPPKCHKQSDTNVKLSFYALSDGVLHFALCVAIKNHLFVGFWLAVVILQPINSRVLGCNTVSKIVHSCTPSERALKADLKKQCQIVCGILFDLFSCMISSVTF